MKIAIAGYGLEGAASYRYWKNLGHDVTILDERADNDFALPIAAKTTLGPEAFSDLEEFDMVVRTAGLPPRRLKGAKKIWSSTNEFFEQCQAPIIGVTGTKGKGTTSSMIAAILRAASKTVHLVGNIGTPALDVLPDIRAEDIVVFELSSFQLWDLERSPHVAVVLMIEPDHLDVHASFDEYVAAKANIALHQTEQDTIVYNVNNQFSTQIAAQSRAGQIAYPFNIDEFIDSLQVPGMHNVENASAAIAAIDEYVDDPEMIRDGLKSFTGLPHRLKLIRELKGVVYYDDSISTTPGSAVAALKSFPDQHIVIILGGSDKGASYDELVKKCKPDSIQVLAVGTTGRDILKLCHEYGINATYVEGDMVTTVQRAQILARTGGVVVLSPASASFDQYANYAERGEQFIQAVNQLS